VGVVEKAGVVPLRRDTEPIGPRLGEAEHFLGYVHTVCDGPASRGLDGQRSGTAREIDQLGAFGHAQAVQQCVIGLRVGALVAVVGSDCRFAAQIDADRRVFGEVPGRTGMCGVASWHALFVGSPPDLRQRQLSYRGVSKG
jgi:hypothetical protein